MSEGITPSVQEETKRLCREATQGQWFGWINTDPGAGVEPHGNIQGPRMISVDKSRLFAPEDVAFVIHAKNYLESYATLCAAQQKILSTIKERLEKYPSVEITKREDGYFIKCADGSDWLMPLEPKQIRDLASGRSE